jgi:hypothetical protein
MTVCPRPLLALAASAALLGACSAAKPVSESEYNDPRYQNAGQGRMFDSDFTLFGNNKGGQGPQDQGGALGVNAYLWRGALDTLSFMPLSSADPFGGVIITDWYQPPSANGERFKATAYILGRQLRADAIRVTVFRQVQQGGQWVDAPVSPATTGEIENKVLARARELRAQSAASGS